MRFSYFNNLKEKLSCQKQKNPILPIKTIPMQIT